MAASRVIYVHGVKSLIYKKNFEESLVPLCYMHPVKNKLLCLILNKYVTFDSSHNAGIIDRSYDL